MSPFKCVKLNDYYSQVCLFPSDFQNHMLQFEIIAKILWDSSVNEVRESQARARKRMLPSGRSFGKYVRRSFESYVYIQIESNLITI